MGLQRSIEVLLLLVASICFAESAKNLSSLLALIRNPTIRQTSVCNGHAFGEFVPDMRDCRLFYLCIENGQAVLAQCPPKMLFNPDSKLCDTPTNVRCFTDQSTTTTIAPVINNNGNEGIVDPAQYCASLPAQENLDHIVFVASSSSCRQYYICYYGQAVLQECSDNLHWNPSIAKCDLPANAGCTLKNDGTSQNGNNGNGSGGNNGNGGGGGSVNGHNGLINCPMYGQHIFPHMQRCDLFVYCVNGHAVLQQCPFYYDFDVMSRNCKLRRNANCVLRTNNNYILRLTTITKQ